LERYTVYIGACEEYSVEKIDKVIGRALQEIPLKRPLTGKVVIKPNLVMAHPRIATETYTRKEVVEGVIRYVQEKGQAIEAVDVVEKSGLGVTTASMFRYAGYKKLKRKYGVGLRAMEERPRVKQVLQKGQVHSHITIAREMAERDFLVFTPKLKTNVLSHAYTGALKLNVGSIDSKERILHHDHNLPAKIVDILEAANPDLIVTDGIRFSYGGNQMTQTGTELGALVISTNAVAHDMVCAKMLNLDPFKIDHIREAMDRGYGPKSFDQIDIIGDFPVERAQEITKSLDYGFYPVDQFKCNFKIHSGSPYCTGGCHGIFLDWLHMVKDRAPNRLKRFPKIDVIVGRLDKATDGKKVLLVGDCAVASTHLEGKKVIRIKGCPPTHKRIVWDMMVKLRLFAPLVRPSLIIDGFGLYPLKRIKGWLVNLRFKPLGNKSQQ
jgi:uncharacterized protein (DUF362 family)